MKPPRLGLSLILLGFAIGTAPQAFAKNPKHERQSHPHQAHRLPPGLEKKAARGEALPPGWQKKLHRGDYLNDDYYKRANIAVPIDKDGNVTLDIDGTLIKVQDKTRRILGIINQHTDGLDRLRTPLK